MLCRFIYIYIIYHDGYVFSCSRLMLDRALAVAGLVKEVSWGLSCPFHCGVPFFPAFFCGLAFGLLIGILLTIFLLRAYSQLLHPASPAPWTSAPPPFVPSKPRRSRLAGYLDE